MKYPSYTGSVDFEVKESRIMVGEKRIAFVTGANRGIGLEIAQQLGQAGVCVIIGARDSRRAKVAAAKLCAAGFDAKSVVLDLTDPAGIAAAAEMIRVEYGRLDILINNAGIVDAHDGPPTTGTADAARRIIETNFIGTLVVTQAMLPLLRQAPAARIVNVSSSLGSLTLNGDPTSKFYNARLIGYNASKAALNMLTVQLAEELRGTRIIVNSVSPGYVKTDLNDHKGVLSVGEGAKIPVKYALLGDDPVSGRFVEGDEAVPW
ncbi:SDR family oxidoreductase [Falsirhodobacter halotolerans]|uniref:SDR family oxidoreductase n=1 Tax=Falsirhodobacter halotolerans TaxID=1146892 RepID=UPI001FD61607|nr:SDR family oxidoreductase [Falsirhodobacter halotolerans]MCJ8138283.1 SDR family oxidoreductase [Falsirhodobacter halotolerans]